MNVVDSSGWLAYFSGGANADFFAPAIEDFENLLVPAICMYEVFKRFLILHNEDEALKVVGIMSTGNVSQLTREISIDAALISKENQLAMADSIILATAKAYGAMLWTQAKDFSEFEGVQYRKS